MSKFQEAAIKWGDGARPMRRGESKQFDKFDDFLWVVGCFSLIVCSYIYAWILGPKLQKVSDWIAENCTIFAPRIQFLENYDHHSHLIYSATILSCASLLPVFLILLAIAYWKTVVAKRLCESVSRRRTPTFMAVMTVIFGSFFYFFFLFVPFEIDPRYPGHARIFLWPLFPIFSSLGAYLFTRILFVNLVGIMKLAFLPGGHRG
nr:hypothetical protein [uncultured Cohaesibacter sp.]